MHDFAIHVHANVEPLSRIPSCRAEKITHGHALTFRGCDLRAVFERFRAQTASPSVRARGSAERQAVSTRELAQAREDVRENTLHRPGIALDAVDRLCEIRCVAVTGADSRRAIAGVDAEGVHSPCAIRETALKGSTAFTRFGESPRRGSIAFTRFAES